MAENGIGILLIASTYRVRKELRPNLEACGFTIAETCDAADAVQTLDEGFNPHIIVTDMNAREIADLRQAAWRHAGRDIRIIALAEIMQQLGEVKETFVRPVDYMLFSHAMRGMGPSVGPMGMM